MNLLLELKKFNPELIKTIEEKSLFNKIFKEYMDYKKDNIYVKYAKLLKNIGQIYRDKKYDGISIYMSLNFLRSQNLKDEEIIKIFHIISEERFILKWEKDNKLENNLYRYEKDLLFDLLEFHSIKLDYTLQEQKIHKKKNYSVNILCGPPGVGKSTLSKKLMKEKSMYISRDKCTMEIGELYGVNAYDEAFDLSDKKHIEAQVDILDDAYEKIAYQYDYDIIVDNISLGHKYRSSWIKKKKNTHNIKVFLLIKDLEDIFKNNELRKSEGKTINEKTVLNKLERFIMPLISDGYDEVEIILG